MELSFRVRDIFVLVGLGSSEETVDQETAAVLGNQNSKSALRLNFLSSRLC